MAKLGTPPRKKVGRNWYVVDREGKIVEGLSYDTGNGYYFYSGWRNEVAVKQHKKTRKDYQFGRDYDEAVYLFNNWRIKEKTYSNISSNSIKEIGTPIKSPQEVPEDAEIIQEINEDGDTEVFAITRQIDDDEFWARARSMILQDIKTASKRLGFPALLDIESQLLKHKSVPNLTISNIFDFYWDFTTNKPQEKGMIRKAINDFKEYIKSENISEIDEYDVINFNNYLHSEGHTSNFINKRIERVITCLNFYNDNFKKINLKENVHKIRVGEIVGLICDHSSKRKEEIEDTPKTFDIETLTRIFNHIKDDKEFTLINLLALNCGFTPIDIENFEKNMIREKDGFTFISYPRLKTHKTSPRVIILWDKTVKLLKEYMIDNPSSTKYIFLNSAKTNLKKDKIQDRFRQLKGTITHTDGSKIHFKNYKDTVASSLVYKVDNTDLLTITLGHDFGGKKKVYWKYIETSPREISSVPQILYDKFKSVIENI